MNMAEPKKAIKTAILTVSDSCSSGTSHDRSGENLKQLLESGKYFDAQVVVKDIIPDDLHKIQEKLINWADHLKVDLILTTGGTGFAPRDVTPEATKAVLEKEAPGMTYAMIQGSLKITPLAMLSRLTCGTRGKTLIINFPGSTKASAECFQIVSGSIGHAVDLLRDNTPAVAQTHTTLHNTRPHLEQSSVQAPHPPTDSPKESPHHHHHHHSHGSPVHHSCVHTDKVALRARESTYPMVSVEEALATVLDYSPLLPVEQVHISDALGRYLAEAIQATDPLPPFPASIKDGYAVRAEDGAGLRMVLGESSAGDVPQQVVTSGVCMRINTGAPVPAGADAVIQVEDTELVEASRDGSTEIQIKILKAPTVGQDIRSVGSDIKKGETVLSAGERLGPGELGILATVGVTSVQCYRIPIVGVMSTGNELAEPTESLSQGKIRDCNRTSLLSLLQEHRIPSVDLGVAKDTPLALLSKLKDSLDKVDIIVTTGGVSMGDKDYLKQVLEQDLKAKIFFARVFMKPGKPTTFAGVLHRGKSKLVFGLPGNPVSALVTANLYLIPAVRKMSSTGQANHTIIKVKVDRDLRLDPRPEYHRAHVVWEQGEATPTAYTTGNQISSRILSMRTANVLLRLPPRSETLTSIQKDSVVDALLIGRL